MLTTALAADVGVVVPHRCRLAGWRYVWTVCIGASRAKLLETLGIEKSLADEEKAPDYNVAPTQTSPTVLARQPRGSGEDAEPVRQLRNLKWGLLPDHWGRTLRSATPSCETQTA
jgi:putative SOS response-associated peptidase YedK